MCILHYTYGYNVAFASAPAPSHTIHCTEGRRLTKVVAIGVKIGVRYRENGAISASTAISPKDGENSTPKGVLDVYSTFCSFSVSFIGYLNVDTHTTPCL